MKKILTIGMIAFVLVLLLMNASPVMAQTLKYIPSPQELPEGFYYTSIEVMSPSDIDSYSKEVGVKPIYGEMVEYRCTEFQYKEDSSGGSIYITEYSNIEDAKTAYKHSTTHLTTEFDESLEITEIDAFGDESLSCFVAPPYFVALIRNDKFIAQTWESADFDTESSEIVFTQILPKTIDEKLEQIVAPTPTPTPTVTTSPTPTASPTPTSAPTEKPELSISQSSLKEEPEVGEEVLITVAILNKGKATAKNIHLEEQIPSSISVNYVAGADKAGGLVYWNGELAPGEAHSITHTLRILEEKSRAIPVTVTYEDAFGTKKQKSTEIYLTAEIEKEVPPTPSPLSNIPWLYIIILVAVVLVGLAIIVAVRRGGEGGGAEITIDENK